MSNYCKNCYELQEQLDQLKEELAISIQENEEGREINAELKAKNEELKRQLTILDDETIVVEITEKQFEEYQKLKAENDKLKEFQNLLEEQMKFNKSELELYLSSEIKRSEFLLKEFKKADTQRDNWREKAEKLKQTLTEIKEIAEENDELLQGYHKEWANNKIILEKISEVLDV